MTLSSRCAELLSEISAQAPDSLNDYTFLGSNDLADLFGEGRFSTTLYDSKITQTIGAWVIIAVLSLLVYVVFVINAIWIRNWPHKAKGTWACCRLPRNRKHTNILLVIGLILCTAAFAASIAGAVLGKSNRDTGDRAACAMLYFLDHVKNGSLTQNWGGTTQSLASYQMIAEKITNAITAISTTFSTDDTAMNLKLTAYQDDLTLLETNQANYYVKSAQSGSTTEVEPTYITELSPIATAGKHLNTLKAESDTLATTVTNSAQKLTTEVADLQTKTSTYQTDANKAASLYAIFANAVSANSQLVTDYVEENYSKWVNINNGVMVSFYVCIGLTAEIIISILFHHKFRSQIALQFAYIGWNFLMLWTVVNGAFAANMQALKKRSSETCDVFNLIASSEAYIDRIGNQYVDFPATLKSCFFSSGDTFTAVTFDDAGTQLGLIATYIREVEPYLVSGPRSTQIAAQKKIIDMYIQGLIPANSDTSNADGTVTNLELLNDYSNSAVTGNKQTDLALCSVSKDQWVLNLTNCTTSLFSPVYQPADYFGESICLSILSLDSGNIADRYKDANFPGCQQVGGDSIADVLVDTYNALNSHFEDTRIKFTQLKRFYENNLNFKYNETIKAAYTMTQPIEEFNSTFSGFLKYVTYPETGILNNSNCSFFKGELLSSNTYLCNTAANVEKTFIAHVIGIVSAVVGCVFVYLYLRKLEGTFRLVSTKEESDLEDLANTPVPQELQNLDHLNNMDNDRVLEDQDM